MSTYTQHQLVEATYARIRLHRQYGPFTTEVCIDTEQEHGPAECCVDCGIAPAQGRPDGCDPICDACTDRRAGAWADAA